MIAITCVAALLIAAAVVVALRGRRQPLPSPEVPVAQKPAEVRVKAVERNPAAVVATAAPDASRAVAIVCGADSATADRYETRNDALRSIARRRDLEKADIAALMAYLRSRDDAMRVERVAAIKNDVMNLLRNQVPMPDGLAETLIGMFEGKLGDRPCDCAGNCIIFACYSRITRHFKMDTLGTDLVSGQGSVGELSWSWRVELFLSEFQPVPHSPNPETLQI